MPAMPYLAIVRQGDSAALGSLYEHLDRQGVARDLVEVRGDQRLKERRAIRQVVLPERRGRDRRRPAPETWTARGFLLVRGGRGGGTVGEGAGVALPSPGVRLRAVPPLEAARPAPGIDRAAAPVARPGLRSAVSASPAAARPVGVPGLGVARLRNVVLLAKAGAIVYPGFYDATAGGWRCGRCDGIVLPRALGADTPRRGEACVGCRTEIVRVLRWRWQRVNWLALATLVFLALVAARTVWPIVSRML